MITIIKCNKLYHETNFFMILTTINLCFNYVLYFILYLDKQFFTLNGYLITDIT